MTFAKLGAAAGAWQVSRSLSLSFLPPEVAVTVSLATAGLSGPTPTLIGILTTPGGVHASAAAGSSAASAAESSCAAGPLAGFTVGDPDSVPGVHDPSPGMLMQAWRPKVQTPSTLPS